jgi:hypothetical protein
VVTGFALRAPWYARQRAGVGLRDRSACRPVLQMYDGPDLVERLIKDPQDSLVFGSGDMWSYPVPVTPGGAGRLRLATHRFVTTDLRKLYQPLHNRFYAVVVEVFCDQPGLPRAGGHDDLEVGFVVRRHLTTFRGGPRPTRELAKQILTEVIERQDQDLDLAAEADQGALDDALDVRLDRFDLAMADRAWRARVAEENADLVARAEVEVQRQGWVSPEGEPAAWRVVEQDTLAVGEQTFPMWRLPPRDADCDRARTRSLWFGLVPTHSDEHQVDCRGRAQPKYDDHAIYEVDCFVRQAPPPGHEHCPPRIWLNELPTAPFRIASVSDPQGSANRTTTIVLPDLRRLAARAGQPMGPGGVQIVTPPGSGLSFDPLGGIPDKGSVGGIGQICTFAFELFFIVAFFLFLLFMPIVVFIFQLWWMLALRLCLPPSVAFNIAADFFADGGVLADFEADADFSGTGISASVGFDQMFGTDSSDLPVSGVWLDKFSTIDDPTGNPIGDDPVFMAALTSAGNPRLAAPDVPPEREETQDDPLCEP